MTKYMLDTNIASFLIKGKNQALRERVNQYPVGSIYVSSITVAELYSGVRKTNSQKLKALVDDFLNHVSVCDFTSTTADTYAVIRSAGEKKGVNLSAFDMLILAHAADEDCTLITNDQAFFKFDFIANIEDWTK